MNELRDNMLVTVGMRIAYMEDRGDIPFVNVSTVEDEAKVAKFAARIVDYYLNNNLDDNFDEYIETAILTEYGFFHN